MKYHYSNAYPPTPGSLAPLPCLDGFGILRWQRLKLLFVHTLTLVLAHPSLKLLTLITLSLLLIFLYIQASNDSDLQLRYCLAGFCCGWNMVFILQSHVLKVLVYRGDLVEVVEPAVSKVLSGCYRTVVKSFKVGDVGPWSFLSSFAFLHVR